MSAIVAIDVATFAREMSLGSPAQRDTFVDGFALIPYDLTHLVRPDGFPVPTLATLVTSQFVHGSVSHIAINMLFFVAFAPEIEKLLGHVRLVAFYLICGVLGGLAQVSTSPASHVPTIGASSAIAGILGAYLVKFPTRSILHIPAFALIGLWAAVQFIHGFGPVSERELAEPGGATAYFAHIGGFLAGVILIGAFAARRNASPRGRPTTVYTR